nr:McmG [Thermoactinomyces sp.]
MSLLEEIEVLSKVRRTSPLISMQMWIDAGSADEGEDQYGVAHFLEHLFLGQKGNPSSPLYDLEQAGALLHGITAREYTVYQITCLSKDLSIAIEAFQQLTTPFWNEEAIKRERAIVLHELRMRQADPNWVSRERKLSSLWKEEAYQHPILGSKDSIEKIEEATIADFFHHYYQKQNMLFVITGNIKEPMWTEEGKKKQGRAWSAQKSRISPTFSQQDDPKKWQGNKQKEKRTVTGWIDFQTDFRSYVRSTLLQDVAALQGMQIERMPTRFGGVTLVSHRGKEKTQVEKWNGDLDPLLTQLTSSDWEGIKNRRMRLWHRKRQRMESWAMQVGFEWFYFQQVVGAKEYEEILDQIELIELK